MRHEAKPGHRGGPAPWASLGIMAAAGCEGNVVIGPIYIAPWIVCLLAAAAPAYVLTRLCEQHLFDHDPRYFGWLFLPLTVILGVAFWYGFARG